MIKLTIRAKRKDWYIEVTINSESRISESVLYTSSAFLCTYVCRCTCTCTVEPLYSGHLWGTTFGPYTEVAFIEGLFCTQTVHLGPGCLAVISPGGLYSGVAVKRGSTVYTCLIILHHFCVHKVLIECKFIPSSILTIVFTWFPWINTCEPDTPADVCTGNTIRWL